MVDTDHEDGEDWRPTFYVGLHESKRTEPVTNAILDQAYNCNYDMLTTPITTDGFQSRVHGLLSDHLSRLQKPDDMQFMPPAPRITPLTVHDTRLTPEDITSKLFAFVSPWIDLCSPDPMVSGISRQILYLEVAYAAFCGIEHVFLPSPRLCHGDVRTHGAAQYARAVQEVLSIGSHVQFHLNLSMSDYSGQADDDDGWNLASFTRDEYLDQADELRPTKVDWFGTWEAWNLIRTVCKYSNRLFVALSIPHTLPPLEVQSRWYSEPIKVISLHSSSFWSNDAGYPCLSKVTRGFIGRLMRLKIPPWILLCDVGSLPGLEDPDEKVSVADGFLSPEASKSPTPSEAASAKAKPKSPKHEHALSYLNYVRHLQREQPARSAVEKYGSGYQDYLQIPLQPLADNLESMTYEVFEKDPIKYNLYEEAIRNALRDWKNEGKPASSPDGKVVVAVAGAGRGPLVTRALRASESEGVEIELWAVEKNPNAYVLLQRLEYHEWRGRVTVVQADMRSWKGPWREDVSFLDTSPLGDSSGATSSPVKSAVRPGHSPIDILVSELLGSFADNELSPECLDGVLHLLQPTHGISIPRSYTAYLTPIAAPKLHADISSRSAYDPTAPETPSVVWLHSIDYLSQQTEKRRHEAGGAVKSRHTDAALASISTPHILPAWSFHHTPKAEKASYPADNRHNERFARLNFRTRDRAVCHGLAGYFEAVLYPGVELSTNPLTMDQKSPNMISWFPIFFPLKVSLPVLFDLPNPYQTPLSIPDHASLTVSIWRQTDDRKVWYEWLLEAWGITMMVGGEHRRVKLGVSDLHSSIKGGCLM